MLHDHDRRRYDTHHHPRSSSSSPTRHRNRSSSPRRHHSPHRERFRHPRRRESRHRHPRPPPPPPPPLPRPRRLRVDSYDQFKRYHFEQFRGYASVVNIARDFREYLKDILSRKGADEDFFFQHEEEEWFQERYKPSVVWRRKEAFFNDMSKRANQFMEDLKADRISLDQTEKDKKTENSPDEKFIDNSLFIRAVSPRLPRTELENLVSSIDGFVSLMLSEPSRRRKFSRVGWVQFESQDACEQAIKKLDGISLLGWCILNFVPNDGSSKKMKYVSPIFLEEERMAIDLKQMLNLIQHLEANSGGSRDSHFRTSVLDSCSDIKSKIVLCLEYLRRVFYCCYYCAQQFIDEDEMHSRCYNHMLMISSDEGSSGVNENFMLRDIDMFVRDLLDTRNERFSKDELESRFMIDFFDANVIEREVDQFSCGICSKLFLEAKYVKKHLHNKHKEEMNRHAEKSEEFEFFRAFVSDRDRPSTFISPERDVHAFHHSGVRGHFSYRGPPSSPMSGGFKDADLKGSVSGNGNSNGNASGSGGGGSVGVGGQDRIPTAKRYRDFDALETQAKNESIDYGF